MLAENLVDTHKPVQQHTTQDQMSIKYKEVDNDINESPELNFGKWEFRVSLLFTWQPQNDDIILLIKNKFNTFWQNLSQTPQTGMKIIIYDLKMSRYVF